VIKGQRSGGKCVWNEFKLINFIGKAIAKNNI
jgi:hypothetical protein